MAKLYKMSGETSRAIEELKKVVALAAERSDVHYMLFELYRNSGNKEAAEHELNVFKSIKSARERKHN